MRPSIRSSPFYQHQICRFPILILFVMSCLATSCQSIRPSYSFQPAPGTASTYPTAEPGGAPQARPPCIAVPPHFSAAASPVHHIAAGRLLSNPLRRWPQRRASGPLAGREQALCAALAVHQVAHQGSVSNDSRTKNLICLAWAVCVGGLLGLKLLAPTIFGTGLLPALLLVLLVAFALWGSATFIVYLLSMVGVHPPAWLAWLE